MGMFDSVFAKCPECGGEVEFQSKQGPCHLAVYPLEAVPNVIAVDLLDERRSCPDCGRICRLVIAMTPPPTTRVMVVV